MERIASFTVDHIRLNRGIYVSRIDEVNGNYLTSFDIRMKLPNREPVKDEIVYFGPMGCRTGFYLILKGKLESKDIVDLMKELYKFMAEFKGAIPGATAIECGNYLDQNLPMANFEAKKYLEETLEHLGEENLNYPE